MFHMKTLNKDIRTEPWFKGALKNDLVLDHLFDLYLVVEAPKGFTDELAVFNQRGYMFVTREYVYVSDENWGSYTEFSRQFASTEEEVRELITYQMVYMNDIAIDRYNQGMTKGIDYAKTELSSWLERCNKPAKETTKEGQGA